MGLLPHKPQTSKVYDSGLNIWYASEDLPEDDSETETQLLNWNDDLLWINSWKIWKFEIDTWSLLTDVDAPNLWQFAFPVPNDFVPDCTNKK